MSRHRPKPVPVPPSAPLVLASCFLLARPLRAEIVYEVDVTADQGAFAHPFNVMNAFWPIDVPADYKAKHPFVEYYAFFNAFGTNPGLPQHELYDEDAGGNPVYHFDRLTGHIDTVLAAGLKPYLALGGCPVKLANDPGAVSPAYGTMTCRPSDYDKYKTFVTAFFNDLNAKYGAAAVASWRFRFMTEPDNTEWWTETRDEWFKFYDYTVSGARAANPAVRISHANLMRHSAGDHNQWLVPYAERVHNGTFAVAGESPYVPQRITFSFYSPWRVNQGGGPWVMEADSDSIRAALSPYPEFGIIPLGIDEGYVGKDENDRTIWARVDGTEWGGAHFAYLAQVMMDKNWDNCALWEPGDHECPPPMRNVLNLIDEMDGMTRLSIPRTSGTPPSGYYTSALAATDGTTARVMLAYYNALRTASTPEQYRVVVSGLVPGEVDVTHCRIDRDHGNYRTQWLIDSAGYPRTGDNSQYDMNPLNGLWSNTEAIDLWNANLAAYKVLAADMDMGTSQHTVDGSGTIELTVTMPAHGVSFLDVAPHVDPPLSVALSPDAATEADGMLAAAGTVSAPSAVSADLAVTLSSGDTTEATVSATVTISAGTSSAAFDVTVVDDDLVDGDQVVTIAATASGYAPGSATMTVRDEDVDVDGLPDDWERRHFSDLTHDPDFDEEPDGLTNIEEFQAGSDPNAHDTDGDGIPDGQDRDPLSPPDPFHGPGGGCASRGGASSILLAFCVLLAFRARRGASQPSPREARTSDIIL